MAVGPLGISYPKSSRKVTPTAVPLPMNGYERQGYRLGYGGGQALFRRLTLCGATANITVSHL